MSSFFTQTCTFFLFLFIFFGAEAAEVAGVVRVANPAADSQREYVLGAGDIIRVSVFQNPDLTVETRISEAGTITFPLVGTVPVGGLSIQSAEQTIARMLRDGGFVVQPQVNAIVMQYRSAQVSVLGLVNRPGKYPLELASSHVTDVLALAGGIMPGAADIAVVTGMREGKSFHVEVNIPAMTLSGDMGNNIAVQNGDIIYVHRAPQFYVYGEVQRPGAYRIETNMTVMQALAQGGGLTLRGTERGIRVHRRNKEGKVEKLDLVMDDLVKADDVIYVRESLF
ncbi:MAG: polysaccharide export protein EpsE [Rugosibacter sp.]|nr:polysaccharide export protein EpsE [Rugosibacter sp.]